MKLCKQQINMILDGDYNIEVDGYIVVFAELGLWNGKHKGSAVMGSNINNIFTSKCDYVTWYYDSDIECDAEHHDGINHYLYRLVKDNPDEIVYKIIYENMTKEEFCLISESLVPYLK